MSFKLIIIVILTSIKLASSKRPFDIILDELKCTHYGPPVKEASCRKYIRNNRTFIDGNLMFSHEVQVWDARIVVEIPRPGQEPLQFLNLTLDGCKLLDDNKSSNILKSSLEMMRRSGYVAKKCPIPANENFTLSALYLDADMLPSFSPDFWFSSNVDFIFEGRIVLNNFAKGRVERKRRRGF